MSNIFSDVLLAGYCCSNSTWKNGSIGHFTFQ